MLPTPVAKKATSTASAVVRQWQSALRRAMLPLGLLGLAIGLWLSPQAQQIGAGVAIFLFGMLALEQGFKAFNGGAFERLLGKATKGLGRSISFGAITTSLMQSSSLVSVLTISFLSAGLITLQSGIGVIFGANLGTTTGAWLIAGFGLKVNIAAYAMPMLIFGVIGILQKTRWQHASGYVLAGLGFLFLGIHFMKEGFETYKDSLDLAAYALPGWKGLLLYTSLGVVATVVMQSSHATLVLTITALSAQQLSYENALGLAIGSNLGTTISAIIGALGANIQGRRLAAAHVIFNVITGIVALLFIGQMVSSVDFIAQKLGVAANDYTLKLAIFHTMFNVLGLVLMVPLIGRLVSFLTRVMAEPPPRFEQPLYLLEAAREVPETAIEAIRQETLRLYDRAVEIISHGVALHRDQLFATESLEILVTQSRRPFPESVDERYEESIKSIYSQIVEFSSLVLTDGNSTAADRIHSLRAAGKDLLEAVKALKHLQKNLLVQMRSSNPAIRKRYDALRQQVAGVMRAIQELRLAPQEDVTVLSLDAAMLQFHKANLLTDSALDLAMREKLFDARVATSLMKDAGYASVLCTKLIDAARVLLASTEDTQRDVESSVALTEEEIAAAAEG